MNRAPKNKYVMKIGKNGVYVERMTNKKPIESFFFLKNELIRQDF